MIDTTWVAIVAAAIVIPAIAYGEYLHGFVFRKMFGGEEVLDNLEELADQEGAKNAAKPSPDLPRSER